MKELLRLENINYKYENKYPALVDVSAVIHEGERIAVIGGNGAGKSTFFLCCNGVLRPDSGKILLKGKEVTSSKDDVSALRRSVGLVFQNPDDQIIAGTVESEVSFGPMNLRLDQEEVALRVSQSLSQVNLEGYEKRAPQYLSGGEKKRVSIADILAMRPDMLLLDEPTSSLDPENVGALKQTLDELSASGITLIAATHDVDFAYRFAERVIVFCRGEIILDAGAEEAFASDAALAKAGLKKPLLYEMAELLFGRFPEQAGKKPRSIEEFKFLIGE